MTGRRRRRQDLPDGGHTMQIDALVDDMEELAPPPDGLGSMPPPLPPKRFSNGMLLGVVLVVLLAAGLGVAAGTVLLGSEPQPVAPAGAEEAAGAPGATPTEPAVAEAAEPDEADGEQAGEQSGEVLQLEEVVFEGE